MFSDKTSFTLAIAVSLGFIISGILDILDNIVVIALISVAFILVVANLFTGGKAPIKDYEKKDSTKENMNIDSD
ncbi:hypothetical protein [Formosa sp. 4Alg 33]|uniref:hypothetical protein n=1 Tax=Formosa sp. 4Alg 33 TaxID=3382189 RepID=UPI003D9C370F